MVLSGFLMTNSMKSPGVGIPVVLMKPNGLTISLIGSLTTGITAFLAASAALPTSPPILGRHKQPKGVHCSYSLGAQANACPYSNNQTTDTTTGRRRAVAPLNVIMWVSG